MAINYWHPFVADGFYHIYNRSNNKETIFKSDDNYRFFLQRWDAYLSLYFDTFSYALIPNHFHFLVRVRATDRLVEAAAKEKTQCGIQFSDGSIELDVFLEDQMKRFLSSYAKAFNKQQAREGSVFQKRFKRVLVKTEAQLCYLIAYHHHNPIHHGIAQDFKDWKYTSFLAFISAAPTKICREAALSFWQEDDLLQARQLLLEYHEAFRLDKQMETLRLED